MNLVLSRHGIWYSRFTYLLPCGRRKEIRRSLRTRSKRIARCMVQQMQLPAVSQAPRHDAGQQSVPVNQPTQPIQRTLKLSKAIELWMDERAKEGLGERELRRIRTYVEALLAVVGDKQVHTIKRQQANALKDSLTSSDKSVTTINNYLKRAKALFDWLSTRYDDLPNPFIGLRVKQNKTPAEQRKAFSPADLSKLDSEAKHLPAYKRWIFDIARYTGMRQNEICQLYKDDIRQVDGVWCFRVTDSRPDQQLKSTGSRRTIPIPTKLLERGILEFSTGTGRLFPELTNTGERGYARYFQKWYSNWKKSRGLPDFHSLRHTVATRLKSAGVPEQYAAQLLGHAAGGITYNRYGKDVPIERLVELVELL